MPYSKIYLFAKKLSMKKSSASTHGSQGTAQTLRWSCERIILSTGHFEDLTESNWTVGKRALASDSKTV